MEESLHARIGSEKIRDIVQSFYSKCMTDPILAHFFMHIDHDRLVEKQLEFVSNLLGGPRVYRGPSLTEAHIAFSIRPPHFARRQILLAETMQEHGLHPELARAWLVLEEKLRPLIMNQDASCRD